jgi:hypothetical protein
MQKTEAFYTSLVQAMYLPNLVDPLPLIQFKVKEKIGERANKQHSYAYLSSTSWR